MDLQSLGEKIKALRVRRGLTQQHLASALGVTAQAVSKWERGENAPDLFAMPTLAATLNTSVDALLDYEQRTVRQVEGSILFAALMGFTARAEKVTAEELAVSLNGHFYTITECVVQRSGLPIKYIGDAFLGVFIAGEHSLNAVEAAISMAAVSQYPVTIGVATGPFFMGPIGHPEYARLDVIGDYVNLAARVQGWAGTNTASRMGATEDTVAPWLERISCGEPQKVEMKGKTNPVIIREVTGRRASSSG